jgi:hypothetical protein
MAGARQPAASQSDTSGIAESGNHILQGQTGLKSRHLLARKTAKSVGCVQGCLQPYEA